MITRSHSHYNPSRLPGSHGVAPAAKRFQTPLGRFTYRPVNESAFSYGVALQSVAGGSFFLAEPEKAREHRRQERLPRPQQVRIRLDVDTDPPPLARYEVLTLLTPIPFQVRLFALPGLFAGSCTPSCAATGKRE